MFLSSFSLAALLNNVHARSEAHASILRAIFHDFKKVKMEAFEKQIRKSFSEEDKV